MVKIRVYEDKVKDKKGRVHTEIVIFGSLLEPGDKSDMHVEGKEAKVRTLGKPGNKKGE